MRCRLNTRIVIHAEIAHRVGEQSGSACRQGHCQPQCLRVLHYNGPYELYDGVGFKYLWILRNWTSLPPISAKKSLPAWGDASPGGEALAGEVGRAGPTM